MRASRRNWLRFVIARLVWLARLLPGGFPAAGPNNDRWRGVVYSLVLGGWKRMGRQPERTGDGVGIDTGLCPPCRLIADAMHFTVMRTAQRYGELVARLATESTRLGEAKMMGVARLAAADQARLPGDKSQVGFISDPARLGESQYAFIDRIRERRSANRGSRELRIAVTSPFAAIIVASLVLNVSSTRPASASVNLFFAARIL